MEFSFMFMLLLIVSFAFQSYIIAWELIFVYLFFPWKTLGLNIPTGIYCNGRRRVGVVQWYSLFWKTASCSSLKLMYRILGLGTFVGAISFVEMLCESWTWYKSPWSTFSLRPAGARSSLCKQACKHLLCCKRWSWFAEFNSTVDERNLLIEASVSCGSESLRASDCSA